MARHQRGLKCPTRDLLICRLQIYTHSFGLATEDNNEKRIPSLTQGLKSLLVTGGGLTGVRPWGGQVVPGHTVRSPAFSSPSPRQGSRWEAAGLGGSPLPPSNLQQRQAPSAMTVLGLGIFQLTGFVSECISNHQLVL